MKVSQTYKTNDLNLATLISLYYPLWAIDRRNSKKVDFVFKREEGLDDLIESYWRKELQVDPLSLLNQLKVIKSRLYESQ